ncbi:PREDICTED: transcription factor bHLH68-like isoform X2 [Ipomoea nil]|uniref:transcription factor bHLH68-like isoform X2 n=1 Tax=Ipomoea nil TaxID=35883 RepID=UPI000900E87C|nr:PREDICTED: transcription factor bHLH68-like isoform X2 [Ipomoea nil]
MMGGNPTDWWSMMMMMDGTTAMHSQSSSSSSSSPTQNLYGSSSNSLPDNSTQDFPRSWSQLLLGGLGGESEKFGMMNSPNPLEEHKKMENWEDLQTLQNNNNPSSSSSSLLRPPFAADIKQEFPLQINLGRQHHQEVVDMAAASSLSHSVNNNVFNFPSSTKVGGDSCTKNQNHYYSSECNSTSSGGPSKKPRVHHSSSQPSLKLQVRKEKLGDRITALHQIVSPFGKTDTASVLSEAIGYIRFLHSQIQALSTPYMGNNPSGSMARHSHHQQSNNPWLSGGGNKDLRSKGLCLVPVSCIQHVGSDEGGAAGYWAPAHGGAF